MSETELPKNRRKPETMSNLEMMEQNLGMVLGDIGLATHVPDPRLAQSWTPGLAKKLIYLQDNSRHFGLTPHVRALVAGMHRLVEKYGDVSGELARLRGTSTVYYSWVWTNIPAATTSSRIASKVPYSGTPAILRAILLNSELTPVGGFGQLNMAGIDFADPTLNGNVITYDTAPGVAGTPTQRYMDPTPFLHDKTAPWGGREVQFWTDWVLDPAAIIVGNWVNPDPVNPTTVGINYLFTSTPCAGQQYWGWHHRSTQGVGQLMNSIHTAVFGLSNNGLPVLPSISSNPVHPHPMLNPTFRGPS